MLRAWLDGFGQRSRPYFGQVVLAALLLGAVPLAGYFLLNPGGIHPRGERAGPASLLSFLPDSVLLDRGVSFLCGGCFLVGAVLWVMRIGLPWSAWMAALGFNGVVALYLESASQVTHVAHLTCMLLVIHALWYQCYRKEIAEADAEGRFWATELYPQWVFSLSVFALGLFYGLSGLSKLLRSGPGWANGVSLQLWTQLFGDPDSMWTQWILSSRTFARVLQVTTLVGETAGLVAIVWPASRPIIGLLLLGFHVGQIAVFHWGFHANMIMLALFFLPCRTWIDRWATRKVAVSAPRLSAGRAWPTPP
jgi:hypothetical protein